jgi:8-oxo-dGTP diphosphatase
MRLSARPARPLVAASCHDARELAQAMRLAFDFVLLGPVRATPSHPGAQTLGWAGFGALARGASLPVYAIGGMRPDDLDAARQHGAHGLAMITGSWT